MRATLLAVSQTLIPEHDEPGLSRQQHDHEWADPQHRCVEQEKSLQPFLQPSRWYTPLYEGRHICQPRPGPVSGRAELHSYADLWAAHRSLVRVRAISHVAHGVDIIAKLLAGAFESDCVAHSKPHVLAIDAVSYRSAADLCMCNVRGLCKREKVHRIRT